jgi:hypothetical protein
LLFDGRSCGFVGFNARFKRRLGALMSGDDVKVEVEVGVVAVVAERLASPWK